MNTTTAPTTPTATTTPGAKMVRADRPNPADVRGLCPVCGEEMVSVWYDYGDRGTLIVFHCWASLSEFPTCDYRRTL